MSEKWICTSISYRVDKMFRHYNCTTLSTDRRGLMLSSLSRKLTFPDAPSPKTTNLSWWSVGVSSSESDISLVSKQQWVVWTSSESLSHVVDSQRRLFVVTSNALLPVQNSRGLKTRWRSWLPGAASKEAVKVIQSRGISMSLAFLFTPYNFYNLCKLQKTSVCEWESD